MSVVVYSKPGPPDAQIDQHAKGIMEQNSVCGTGGGLGYLMLESSDFERLWKGVDLGDAMGTASDVLHQLGPEGHQFIGRHEDFVYGWVEVSDKGEGRILLLQIIPRPQILAARAAANN